MGIRMMIVMIGLCFCSDIMIVKMLGLCFVLCLGGRGWGPSFLGGVSTPPKHPHHASQHACHQSTTIHTKHQPNKTSWATTQFHHDNTHHTHQPNTKL